MAANGTPLLEVKDLHGHYGESHVLHGMTFDVHPGEVVTLLGRNGAGKTSTLKSIMGVIGKRTGSINFTGTELMNLAEPFAKAFREAGPRERVFFSLQNPNANYETDRTAGSLFVRDG